jgi:hypothetical protein
LESNETTLLLSRATLENQWSKFGTS